MTKPKDLVKIRPILLPLTAIVMIAACFGIKAQSNVVHFDAKILPSLEKITSIQDVEAVQQQIDGLEKRILKDARPDKRQFCESLDNFVVFRFKLHRSSAVIPVPSGPDSANLRNWVDVHKLLEKNVLRAQELYTEAGKECAKGSAAPSDSSLMATFANAWLFDNFRTSLIARSEQSKMDAQAERILTDYDTVLKGFRSREDKSWIDPVLLLYSYSNSLLKQGQFEAAEPLLSESATLASQKYGNDSPVLLPILKLLAGIVDGAGNQSDLQNYISWIRNIKGGSDKDLGQIFEFRGRALPESRGFLVPEKAIMVFGPRQAVEGRLNRESQLKDVAPDLPQPAGQFPHDNNLIGMASGGSISVVVFITIDESGSVVNADVRHRDEKIREKLKEKALGLKFKPVTYKGRPTSMKGFVYLFVNR